MAVFPLPRRAWLPLGLLAVLLCAFLDGSQPGHSGSIHHPSEPIPVRILVPSPFADALAKPAARFGREHPGIRVELVRGPLDTEAISDLAIGSLLLGESPYDLLMVDVTWTAKYAAAGWLRPLEAYLGDDALEEMVPGARLGNRFGGHLWRMPLTGDTGLLFWRTDLMEQPPRSTDELLAMARELQRSGKVRWGYLWQGRQYEGLSCVMLEALHAFGARWWDPATQSTVLGSPAATRAAEWLAMLVRTGVTPPSVANFAENDALQLFAAGEAAFLRIWPYAWKEIEKGGGPVVGKVGAAPVVAAPGEAGGATLGTWGFSLPTASPHPIEAAEVMRWFTGPEVQRELVLDQGYAPTWRKLYEDPGLAEVHPLLAVQRASLEHPLVRPLTPLYAQFSDVLQRQVNGMLTGQSTATIAMEASQGQSEVLVRSAAGVGRVP
jgi:multiple sugar transport system substrate-binding protein